MKKVIQNVFILLLIATVGYAGQNIVNGPASSTDGNIPAFSGTTGDLLGTGYGVQTTVGDPGSDSNLVTEQGVREALAAGGDQLVDIVTTSPLTVNGGANVNDALPGSDADMTFAISDAAADGSTKGAATFNANHFDAVSGVISLDTSNGPFELNNSNDFDTDRLSGDTTDDNLIDLKIIAGLGSGQTGSPVISLNDSDAEGLDDADEEVGGMTGNLATTTEDAEDGVLNVVAMHDGTRTTYIEVDGENDRVEMKKPLLLLSSDNTPSAIGEIQHDSTLNGMSQGALIWFDGSNDRTVVDLVTAPSNDDYVVAYDADNDLFYMKEDSEGSGSVGVSGTPTDGQLAVWTNADTLEGVDSITMDFIYAEVSADPDNPSEGEGQFFISDGTVSGEDDGDLYFINTAGSTTQKIQITDHSAGTLAGGGGDETNSLETTITGIADGEIFIGDDTDSGNFVTITGDASLANTGALTIATDAIEASMILTDAVTMDAVDADGDFTSLTGNWTTTGNVTAGNHIGNVVLDDEDSLEIMADADGMDDNEYNGITITGRNAGEALSQWDLVRLANDADPWHQADADAAGEFPAIGIVVTATSDTNEAKVLVRGVVRNEGWTGLTPGGAVYLSDTAGGVTQTAPSDSGDCVQIVGFALSDSEILFDFSRPYQEVE